MKKIMLCLIWCLLLPAVAVPQTRWMRLHPDVSWKYLEQWEKKHQWLTPAREGRWYFQKHEVGRAREKLAAAVAGGADDGRLLYELGYCCQEEGDDELALRYYREAADRLARLNPDHLYHFNAEYLTGVLYEKRGDAGPALVHYEKAIRLQPETMALRYRKARILYQQGKIDLSLAEIRQVLERAPESGSAAYLAGVLSLEQGNLDAARRHLETAARNGAEAAPVNYCLGYIASRQGRQDEAAALYHKALQAAPAHRETQIALANLSYERDDLAGARRCFEGLVRLEPANARWHYNLGVVYRGLEMDAASARELAEARRLDPELVFLSGLPPEGVPALFAAAARMQAEGRNSEAAALYREALVEDPFFLPSRYNLAVAYSAGGERNQALQQYSRLLRIDPDYAPAHLNSGILAYQKKERADAAHHLRRYLILVPASSQADLIKRYLRELRGW
ncbi:MAG: tetratricopeptide repeat protein [PVC group bacterium]